MLLPILVRIFFLNMIEAYIRDSYVKWVEIKRYKWNCTKTGIYWNFLTLFQT